MPVLRLGTYLTSATEGALADTPYGDLAGYDLADFLARWPALHAAALTLLGEARIHPTARVHPTAIIGDEVILGPHTTVHEFTTVRGPAVVAAGAQIGFNCEVTHTYIGEHTVLGHRIGLNRTLVGTGVHLSSSVTVAAIHISEDMRHPHREVILRGDDGLYRCATPRFGGLIGDQTQTGHNIALGPGIALGRSCRIDSGVTLAARIIPAHHTLSAPHATDTRLRAQRSRQDQ
ncbi:transferase [Streptomyces sp. NPDC019224]|uniref:transferase n=1 Tax=Streptomyces sp. NPDC019224 TaxID=3154484 RepID=UPI0033D05FA3